MSIRYRANDGTETIVSGLTPGGDIEAGVMAQRTGNVAVPSATSRSMQRITVTFSEAMPSADYEVTYSVDPNANMVYICSAESKTQNGFVATFYNATDQTLGGRTVYYSAFALYTVQHAAQNAEDIANIKAVIPSAASSTNKLATSNDVSSLATSTDSRLDDLEDLVPTNASVTNQLATKAEIDNVYTKTEVDTKLDDKQDTLTFDNEPTAGSSNPVKSNGIKNVLDAKQNEQLTNPVTIGSDTYNTVNAALTGIGGMINSGLSLGLTFTSLTNNADINNCTDTTFKIWGSANTATCASFVNGPSGRQNGEMAIIWVPFGNVLYGAQLYFAGAGTNTPQIFIRYRANTTWSNWVKLH